MANSLSYSYRQVTSADISLLKDLLRVFGAAFGEMEVYQGSVPSDDYLTWLLSKQHFIAVVAMSGEEVIGGLAAYELDKFEQDRREIYIYESGCRGEPSPQRRRHRNNPRIDENCCDAKRVRYICAS
jgi:aminoglycoside 3-N-acetyltransferase I